MSLREIGDALAAQGYLNAHGRPYAAALTEAEREVLRLAADGVTAKQMAQSLGISERSVEGRIASAIKTLKARNRTHAVALALRNKLIE